MESKQPSIGGLSGRVPDGEPDLERRRLLNVAFTLLTLGGMLLAIWLGRDTLGAKTPGLGFAWFALLNVGALVAYPLYPSDRNRLSYLCSAIFGIAAAVLFSIAGDR